MSFFIPVGGSRGQLQGLLLRPSKDEVILVHHSSLDQPDPNKYILNSEQHLLYLNQEHYILFVPSVPAASIMEQVKEHHSKCVILLGQLMAQWPVSVYAGLCAHEHMHYVCH